MGCVGWFVALLGGMLAFKEPWWATPIIALVLGGVPLLVGLGSADKELTGHASGFSIGGVIALVLVSLEMGFDWRIVTLGVAMLVPAILTWN